MLEAKGAHNNCYTADHRNDHCDKSADVGTDSLLVNIHLVILFQARFITLNTPAPAAVLAPAPMSQISKSSPKNIEVVQGW